MSGNVDHVISGIQALTADEYADLKIWMFDVEEKRRQAAPIIEQAQAEVVSELWDARPELRPEATTEEAWVNSGLAPPVWVRPTGAHDSYPAGAVVTHAGRVWENVHPGLNSWEPGAVGVDERIWREIAKEDTPAAPPADTAGGAVIEWGPGLPVQPGDRLAYQGAVYEVVQAHTTQADWLPSVLPALYKQVE